MSIIFFDFALFRAMPITYRSLYIKKMNVDRHYFNFKFQAWFSVDIPWLISVDIPWLRAEGYSWLTIQITIYCSSIYFCFLHILLVGLRSSRLGLGNSFGHTQPWLVFGYTLALTAASQEIFFVSIAHRHVIGCLVVIQIKKSCH